MEKISYFWRNLRRKIARIILKPIAKNLLETPVIIGRRDRLHLGERCAVANTIFNLASGDIRIGDRTIFGCGSMVITGTHNFINGKRASVWMDLDDGSWGGGAAEVSETGRDIEIGNGVFIGVGVIILGGVTIGDNCLIAAGSVVTKSFEGYSLIGGVPARKLGDTRTLKTKSIIIQKNRISE